MKEKPLDAGEFVVIEHSHRNYETHWDFMIEADGALLTWRLMEKPNFEKDQYIDSERIFDHNRKFLTYEGPVNDNKGMAKQIGAGKFHVISLDRVNIDIAIDIEGESFMISLPMGREPGLTGIKKAKD